MDLASYYPSNAYNFEIAPRFLKKIVHLWNNALLQKKSETWESYSRNSLFIHALPSDPVASYHIVVQAYTLGPCTKITACSRTAFPPNPSWMDPCWLSKLMSGDLQPADLSIKQCFLFGPRGRRFRPSSTDKVVVTSASPLLIDTGETKANVSRKAIFFRRTNLIKDATVVGVSKF